MVVAAQKLNISAAASLTAIVLFPSITHAIYLEPEWLAPNSRRDCQNCGFQHLILKIWFSDIRIRPSGPQHKWFFANDWCFWHECNRIESLELRWSDVRTWNTCGCVSRSVGTSFVWMHEYNRQCMYWLWNRAQVRFMKPTQKSRDLQAGWKFHYPQSGFVYGITLRKMGFKRNPLHLFTEHIELQWVRGAHKPITDVWLGTTLLALEALVALWSGYKVLICYQSM